MKITFLGAAESVTGSRFLVEGGGARFLVDCGLFQERALRARNWEPFPVAPSGIEAVILTHAHIDHCGYLPKLVREGFRGKIFCTAPTRDITQISLLDSAHLQEADAEYKRRRHQREGRKGKYPEVPLYTVEDAEKVMPLFEVVRFREMFFLGSGVRATFFPAGHILGAAMVALDVDEKGSSRRVVFSGDIGRWDRPILNDPTVFDAADAVVMEATYGNRRHEGGEQSLEKFKEIILSTRDRGGNVVIPTFAIERAQELLYELNRMRKNKEIPPMVTFLDSPMAIAVTRVFEAYPEHYDEESKERLVRYRELFSFPLLKMTATTEESKTINHIRGTALIMAGSGMCTGGRIKHHLANNISRPESTILFVGYQAVGTLGRILLEKPKTVRILGQTFPVRARIEKINGFSAHADCDELMRWAQGFQPPRPRFFIVHSEKEVARDFSRRLQDTLQASVTVARYQERIDLA